MVGGKLFCHPAPKDLIGLAVLDFICSIGDAGQFGEEAGVEGIFPTESEAVGGSILDGEAASDHMLCDPLDVLLLQGKNRNADSQIGADAVHLIADEVGFFQARVMGDFEVENSFFKAFRCAWVELIELLLREEAPHRVVLYSPKVAVVGEGRGSSLADHLASDVAKRTRRQLRDRLVHLMNERSVENPLALGWRLHFSIEADEGDMLDRLRPFGIAQFLQVMPFCADPVDLSAVKIEGVSRFRNEPFDELFFAGEEVEIDGV